MTGCFNRVTATLFLVCVFVVNQNSLATSCEEKSPNYAKSEEGYFDFNDNVVSDADKRLLNDLRVKIVGKWIGVRTLTECENPAIDNANAINQGYKKAKAEVEIDMSLDGVIRMDETLDYHAMNTQSQMVTTFISGVVTDINVAKGSTLDFAEKIRLRSNKGGAVLKEVIGQVKLSNRSLTIEISNYINGFFTSRETWSLKPDKR